MGVLLRAMRGKGRVTLGAFGVSALVLAAAAPGASAAGFGTLSYQVHGPVDARVDGETTTTASCRPGTYVLGGGQYVKAGPRNATIESSAPFDGPDADTSPDDGWRSRVDSFNGSHNSVTEYAICSTRQPRYRKSGYAVGDGPYLGGTRITCPRRDTALGGGIDIDPGYGSAVILVSTLGPPQPTGIWDTEAYVGLTSVPNQRLAGWAICGKAAVTYRTATGELPQDADSGRASAACPANTRLIGGGVRVPIATKFSTYDIQPTTFGPVDGADSGLVPNRWRMEADDWGGVRGDLPLESTAICVQ